MICMNALEFEAWVLTKNHFKVSRAACRHFFEKRVWGVMKCQRCDQFTLEQSITLTACGCKANVRTMKRETLTFTVLPHLSGSHVIKSAVIFPIFNDSIIVLRLHSQIHTGLHMDALCILIYLQKACLYTLTQYNLAAAVPENIIPSPKLLLLSYRAYVQKNLITNAR